ncbi:MAG: flagellar filament capping protein FliD, partial [Planctomycetales bacterium]|nr:flagellar filament capping protein FliD [Planctomycetales bacterium]
TFSGEASQTKLSGDSALRSVKMQLQSVISSAIPASGAFGSLAEIGFSTERDGTLTIDSAKLRDALSQDMDGVAELFTLDNGTDKGVALQFADIVERYTEEPDGILRSKSKSLTSNIDQINKQIADLELRADSYEQSLVRQFAALETLMSEMQTQSSFLAQSTL